MVRQRVKKKSHSIKLCLLDKKAANTYPQSKHCVSESGLVSTWEKYLVEFTFFTGLYNAQSEENIGQTGRKTLEMQASLGSMSCKGRKKSLVPFKVASVHHAVF